jgi:hypothetical protein
VPARRKTKWNFANGCAKQPCALAPLYVGQTAQPPNTVSPEHKSGGKLAAGKPHRFGVKLRLNLMKGIGPFSTRNEAEAAEQAVAAQGVLGLSDGLVLWQLETSL